VHNRTNEISLHNAPLRLGSPLRAPHFTWPDWGIRWKTEDEFRQLVDQSEEAYRIEWAATRRVSHEEIARASKKAGLGNANKQLNEGVAGLAVKLIANNDRRQLRILDLGAGSGATSAAVWDRLPRSLRSRTEWVLLDPAERALADASDNLKKKGMSQNQFVICNQRDMDALPKYRNCIDLIISVAAIHHHGYLDPLFSLIAEALRKGGLFVGGDWHNSLSNHPARMLKLLRGLDWDSKKEDLSLFEMLYPKSFQYPKKKQSAGQMKADKQISNFWTAYAQYRRLKNEDFLVIEGHRPVQYYIAGFTSAGLNVPPIIPVNRRPNPLFLKPGSCLLCVLLAAKVH
jgi:SAM-dependent methyltransferase